MELIRHTSFTRLFVSKLLILQSFNLQVREPSCSSSLQLFSKMHNTYLFKVFFNGDFSSPKRAINLVVILQTTSEATTWIKAELFPPFCFLSNFVWALPCLSHFNDFKLIFIQRGRRRPASYLAWSKNLPRLGFMPNEKESSESICY